MTMNILCDKLLLFCDNFFIKTLNTLETTKIDHFSKRLKHVNQFGHFLMQFSATNIDDFVGTTLTFTILVGFDKVRRLHELYHI
jgi:hypothetical protein